MTTLKSTIDQLATAFAMDILGALRAASIDELTGVTDVRGRRGSARLSRRSADDIGRMVESIVTLLGKHPGGLRAEQIRTALGCEAKELPRPLADAIRGGQLKKTGRKRATTYFGARGGRRAKRR